MILDCYPEYKDSNVEWLGEIPVYWNTHIQKPPPLGGEMLTELLYVLVC